MMEDIVGVPHLKHLTLMVEYRSMKTMLECDVKAPHMKNVNMIRRELQWNGHQTFVKIDKHEW